MADEKNQENSPDEIDPIEKERKNQEQETEIYKQTLKGNRKREYLEKGGHWGAIKRTGSGLGNVAVAGGRKIKTATIAGGGYLAGKIGRYEGTSRGEIRTGGSLWWFFLAVLLYLSDLFFTGFNGFNYKTVMRVFSEGGFEWFRILFNVGVVAIFVGYWVFRKPDTREFLSWAIVVELLWLIITMFGGAGDIGTILHVIFVIVVWLWLIQPAFDDKTQANFLMFIMIFVDFFLFSYIAEFSATLPWFNRITLPVWVFFALAFTKKSTLKDILVFVIIMFYVLNAFSTFNEYNLYGRAYLSNTEAEKAKQFALKSWDTAKEITSKEYWQRIISNTEQRLYGEYYTGEIDQNAQKRLGVYIIDMYPSQTKPYSLGEQVTVFAEIEGETLKKPINISLKCKEGNIEGEMNPSSITVSDYERRIIDCDFKNILSEGSKEIKIIANSNLETSAYKDAYFADKTDFNQKERPEEYLIRKGSPYKQDATVLPGALSIGMRIGDKVIRVERDKENIEIPFVIDFSVMFGWQGKIEKINEIIIQMRNDIELSKEGIGSGRYCNGKIFEKISCNYLDEEGCDDSLYNIYKLNAKDETIGDIEQLGIERISCRINIIDIDDLFGETDIKFVRKTFRVIVNYDYELEKGIGITIRKGEEVKSNLYDCKTICSDSDGCFCPKGCKIESGKTVDEGQKCGVLGGLEKYKLSLPSTCNRIISCDNNEFVFDCDDSVEYKIAIVVFNNGEVIKAKDSEIQIDYDNVYTVVYSGLSHLTLREGAKPHKNYETGRFDETFKFKILKENNVIDILDFYKSDEFVFEGSCISDSSDCNSKCENYKCNCPSNCIQSSIKKEETCGGEKEEGDTNNEKTLLADCDTECDDSDGCICPEGCIVPKTNPIFQGSCGGTA